MSNEQNLPPSSTVQGVEQAKEAVMNAADKLTSIWDVTKANGWTQHAEALDALIAAVQAEEREKAQDETVRVGRLHDSEITALAFELEALKSQVETLTKERDELKGKIRR